MPKKLRFPTADEVRRVLDYDRATGIFRWRVRPCNPIHVGDIAGSLNRGIGYRTIGINGRHYLEHRLAWLHVTGTWPERDLDHWNGESDCNRFDNLRLATESQNKANSKRARNNTSGFKGVSADRGRWRARIRVNGQEISLGHFDTREGAHAAYGRAAVEAFGSFARWE